MTKSLVVVESPAKAKTIKKYLGANFQVLASYGHVRDLLPKEGAVDPENDFAMKYVVIDKNARHVKAIATALKKCDELLLATDPDREGEAISHHVCVLMKDEGVLKDKPVKRVVFHEITKNAILEAIAHSREISTDLVNAQQARRALDYLVGFTLSPLLWRKVRPGLSAGRVQSPALRMIVEREEEIEKFIAKEYWSIEADCLQKEQLFVARLTQYAGEKLKQFSLTNAEQSHEVVATIEASANGSLLVTNLEKKQRKRRPAPPFTTSTLQQEASRKLGFGAQKTMRVAQQLYEGVDVGQGAVGLITYMRTDSVTLAETAITEIRETIAKRYGQDLLPGKPIFYKTKSKNAQEAHEAIRPTEAGRLPSIMKSALSADQFKLYSLIWKRTVACQMIHATLDTVAVDLSAGDDHIFRANGSTITNPGFLKVYEEGLDDAPKQDADQKMLPKMERGDKIPIKEIRKEQHFTEPPPRYSEATLVKMLEAHGIGRPSTYAAIISTLQHREYVVLKTKRFYPTDVGRVVNRFLTTYFTQYVDYDFTATLEDSLDAVSRGEEEWIPLLGKFWMPFSKLVTHIQENVQRKDVTQEPIDEKCPKCNADLSIRLGRRGRFIGCAAYPECDYTRSVDSALGETEAAEEALNRDCPDCQKPLKIKAGKYGKFIGCSGYPDCRHIEPLEKPEDTEVLCPECKKKNIFKRKARSGKIFYSCGGYPDCKYALWNPPYTEPCPDCQWPITMIKTTKRKGTERTCPQKSCAFIEPFEQD